MELDMLHDAFDIKLLIAYVLSEFEIPVSQSQLFEALMQSATVNYFDCVQNFAELIKMGLIHENKHGNLELNDDASSTIEEIKKRLPYTVICRARDSAKDVLTRTRYEKDAPSEIIKASDGYILHCKAIEGARCTFDVKVSVPTMEIAEEMRLNYQKNPFRLFTGIIRSLGSENK